MNPSEQFVAEFDKKFRYTISPFFNGEARFQTLAYEDMVKLFKKFFKEDNFNFTEYYLDNETFDDRVNKFINLMEEKKSGYVKYLYNGHFIKDKQMNLLRDQIEVLESILDDRQRNKKNFLGQFLGQYLHKNDGVTGSNPLQGYDDSVTKTSRLKDDDSFLQTNPLLQSGKGFRKKRKHTKKRTTTRKRRKTKLIK
jgi:hypothetical protein